ncbi:hypothetical protein HDU93_002694 [Gonapodya sp. JEL0774]|nr:hypothetical protein HDU93_002694 [Gonapodya sp. JEL0774]
MAGGKSENPLPIPASPTDEDSSLQSPLKTNVLAFFHKTRRLTAANAQSPKLLQFCAQQSSARCVKGIHLAATILNNPASFISSLCGVANISIQTLGAASLYLRRLQAALSRAAKASMTSDPASHAGRVSGTPTATCRLFMSAIALANKYMNDAPISNRWWAAATGNSERDVNRMEFEFLEIIDYNLSLPRPPSLFLPTPMLTRVSPPHGATSWTSIHAVPRSLTLPNTTEPCSTDRPSHLPTPSPTISIRSPTSISLNSSATSCRAPSAGHFSLPFYPSPPETCSTSPALLECTLVGGAMPEEGDMREEMRTTLCAATNGTTYQFLLQFGEVDTTGQPAFYLSSSTFPPIVTYVYRTPGRKRVNLTISDRAFTAVDNFVVPGVAAKGWIGSLSGSNLANPVAVVEVDVFPLGDCYQFDLKVDWSPTDASTPLFDKVYGGGMVKLSVSVLDPIDPSSRPLSAVLSKAFESLGESPQLILRNTTHFWHEEFRGGLDKDGFWSLFLPGDRFVSSSPYFAEVLSDSSFLLSCSIAPRTFDITMPTLNSVRIGWNMRNSEANGLSGLALKTNGFSQTYIKLRKDTCAYRHGVILLGYDAPSRNGLGALLVSTSVGYGSDSRLLDLTRNSKGKSSTGSLCAGLSASQCAELYVMDVVLVDGYMFFLTSYGLFRSSRFSAERTSIVDSEILRVTTGVSSIDSQPSTGVRNSSLFGQSNCYSDHGYVFLAYGAAGTVGNGFLVYAHTTSAIVNQWSSVISAGALPGRTGQDVFVAAIHDFSLNSNLFLVGRLSPSTQTDCSVKICTYNSASVVIHDNETGTFAAGYTFPASLFVTGIQVHAQEQEVYVFGSELWKSIDGGRYFTLQEELPPGEYFEELDSTPSNGAYALRTNYQRIYYGKTGSDDLVLASSLLLDPLVGSFHNALYFDEVGDASVIKVPHVTDVTRYTNPTLYPLGFLKDSTGTLDENLGITRLSLPITSVVDVADSSFRGVLVPIPLGASRWWMWIYDVDSLGPANGVYWRTWHILKRIVQTQDPETESGECVIDELNSELTVASCLATVNFDHVSSDMSKAVADGLQVSGLNATYWNSAVPPKLQDWNPIVRTGLVLTLVPTTGSNSVTGTWLLSDIGRTIVINGGAIVVTSVVSATSARGLTVWPPTYGTDNTGSITVMSGLWQMYDFRNWIDETQTLAQTVTVQAVGTGSAPGLASCQISAGIMKMSAKHVGMILDISPGFGVIQKVNSATGFEISMLTSIPAAIYPSSAWKIYPLSANFDFSLSTSPPTTAFRRRPWALRVERCRWSNFDSTIPGTLVYLGYHENVTLSSTLRILSIKSGSDTANQLAWASELSFSVTNPTLHEACDISLSGVGTDIQSGLSLTIADTGTMGRNIISIRPAANSLSCTEPTTTVLLFSQCPPTRAIRIEQDLDMENFLYGSGTLIYDIPLVETLPFNYRPPSKEGQMIPTTNNIYNAAPGLPRHNDRYWISRTTGAFKQCANATSRAECNCTDAQRYSEFVADSDCIDKVARALYSQSYMPNIVVYEHGKDPATFTHSFTLKELNGRIDYCISSADNCDDPASLESAVLDPLVDSITWSGSELYHFRVFADFHYCILETEFKVYVAFAPTPALVEQSSMATAAVLFLVWLFVTYMWHSFKAGQGY